MYLKKTINDKKEKREDMSTELSKLRTMSLDEITARLSGVVEQHTNNLDQFMNFDGRIGRYSVPSSGGGEPETYPSGSKVLFNIFDSKNGFACWKGGKVIDSIERVILEGEISPDELADHGPYSPEPSDREGWTQYVTMLVKDSVTGTQYKLRLSSPSARDAFGKLMKEIRDNIGVHDITAETPVVQLGSEPFKAKGQKNYKPRMTIVEWVKNPESEAAASKVEAPEETTKAAISSSRKK